MKAHPASLLVRASVIALLALPLACNKEKGPTETVGGQVMLYGKPETVVASYAGGTITEADLNAAIQGELLQLRRQKLEELLNERLIKAEAAKRGVNEEQLMKAEVDSKIPPPADAEIQQLFDSAKAGGQLPATVTLEQVKPQIVQFLNQRKNQERRQHMSDFLGKLRTEGNARVLLRTPVEAKGPTKGPAAAKVTIVEFSDFQCPYCKQARDTVEQVLAAYPDKVRVVFRQFPLNSIHPQAQKAAEAALCAADQEKFWEYHDSLFANQKELALENLKEAAKKLALNEERFNKCLDSGEKAAMVKADLDAGEKAGVQGTPSFFVNGIAMSGGLDDFKRVIDSELAN